MQIIQFQPEHLQELALQPAQKDAYADLAKKEYGESLAKGQAATVLHEGRIVACTGAIPIWKGRAELWSLIAADIGPLGMHKLHFKAKRWLESTDWRRLEAHCDARYLQAHRWLHLLGFKCEGPLEKYTPDGRDCLRFARVR